MRRDYDHENRYFQYGVVHGGIGECGNNRYPNIFARIEDPEINAFIKEELGKQQCLNRKEEWAQSLK